MDAVRIRQAGVEDAAVVEDMIREAAAWVDALGVVMWEDGELDSERITAEVLAGQFHIAEIDGVAAGAVRFQLEDALFWPDRPAGESAFVHRLVVRRAFKGRGLSRALLEWARHYARAHGRHLLRLDCDASREKLRALYESCGFRLHSYRQVGPYYVSRYEIDTGAGGLGS
jgi:GNAT superfamily N-acetyltransferase